MTSAAETNGRTAAHEPELPPSLQLERHGPDGEVAVLRLSRPAKRNATGKIRRVELRARAAEEQAAVPPRLEGVQ